MEFEEINSFLKITAEQSSKYWDIVSLSQIANQRIPDFIMNNRGSLLRADIHIQWTKWFIESICNPENIINYDREYAYIVNIVQNRVSSLFANITELERQEITRYLSRLVEQEAERRKPRDRPYIDVDTRKLLWDLAGREPRCWICGYKFTKWAENKFLGYPNHKEPPLNEFIDYITLHGLKHRDLCIEIDHALPFSKGGQENEENLKLSCGWCNTHKKNYLSIYDIAPKIRTIKHPKFGKQDIPHPFWIVRLLSVRRSCEYEGGCSNSTNNNQLTVAPRYYEGAINPANLRVTCREHDELGSNRLVSRKVLEQLS
jgi:hypothetical protein